MVGSIDPRCETVRGTHWPKKVAWLFGARVAETILASDPLRPHQQAGHMDASDPIRPEKLLRHGGRPHMKPYVTRNKNDGRDAEGTCEAMSRPTMRFVPVKTAEQQAALMLAGIREQLIARRTQLSNT